MKDEYLPGSTDGANSGIATVSGATQQQLQQPAYVMEQNAPNILGPRATLATCPSCHAQRMSRIEYANSTKTHLIAVALCLTTCCCCIPYCIDSCKNANHFCSSCGAYLGTYNN